MGFWGKKLGYSHLLHIFYWILKVVTVSLTVISIQQSYYNKIYMYQYIFLSPAYIAQIMTLIRYFIVCVKYGFYPPEFFNKFKNNRLTRTEVKSSFLYQGWIKPSLLVLDVYLKEIFQKFNIDVDNFTFECVGKFSECMKNELIEVDKMINEDARKIRMSFTRRLHKQNKLYQIIQENLNKENKPLSKFKKQLTGSKSKLSLVKENEYLETSQNKASGSIDLTSSKKNFSSNDHHHNSLSLFSNIVNLSALNARTRNKRNKPYLEGGKALNRLREIIITKILPEARKRVKMTNFISLEGKVNLKNEDLYEIKGIFLARIILKNVFTIKVNSYSFTHKVLVFFIIIIPFMMTITYVLVVNYFVKQSREKSDIKLQYNDMINFNYVTIAFLAISLISLIPPVWLNTQNFIYGIIDFKRKRRLMEGVSEMMNSNLKEDKRKYPLLNVADANTMLNWYHLRLIFMSIGKRYTDRIQFQTSIFILFVFMFVLLSMIIFFGSDDKFIAITIGISFSFSILVNFVLMLKMFLLGAEINYFEYCQADYVMSHKLLLNDLIVNLRRMDSKQNGKRNSLNLLNNKSWAISNSYYSDLFVKAILHNKCKGDIYEMLNNCLRVLEDIKEKIRTDAIVRPLKLFWIKADYLLLGNIVAVLGGGIAILFKLILNSVDFNVYFTKK